MAMKVMAKISDNMVLCEVSAAEIARLRGCTSTYDKEWHSSYLNVGMEHDLSRAFETLDTLRKLDDSQFKEVSRVLARLNQTFEDARAAQEALMLFDTLKEAGDDTVQK
jgi:hypothetical protein